MSPLLLAVAVVLVLFVLMELGARIPVYYRRKPLGFIESLMHRFASCTEGAVLIIERNGTEQFLQFRKAADTGGKEQEVVFGFPNLGWCRAHFALVADGLAKARVSFELVASESTVEDPGALEVKLRGDRHTLGVEAHRLVRAVGDALGYTEADRFTFHVEGTRLDPRLDARVNQDTWRYVQATSPSRFARWIARRNLRRID